MKAYTRSSRSVTGSVSSSCCLSAIFRFRCEAMVSASLLQSSIWLTETNTSGGIFLFSLMYCSNWDTTARARASSSSPPADVSCIGSAWAWKKSWFSANSTIFTLWLPSTSTLTVPSGSFKSCSTVAMVPTR